MNAIRAMIEGFKAQRRLAFNFMFPIKQYEGMHVYHSNDILVVVAGVFPEQAGIVICQFGAGDIGIVVNDGFLKLPQELQMAGYAHEQGHYELHHSLHLKLYQKMLKTRTYMKQEYEADAYAANKVGKQAVLQLLHHFKQLKGVSQTEMNNRINAIHKGNYA